MFLQVLVGLLFFVFVVRFWYLQVHRGEEFARQAQENRLRQERIFAPRGRILDDGDKLLADNRTATACPWYAKTATTSRPPWARSAPGPAFRCPRSGRNTSRTASR